MLDVWELFHTHPTIQIYTHFDEVEGQIDIAVGLIEARCKKLNLPTHRIPISPAYAKVIKKQRGLEVHRLKRLTVEICDANPMLFLEFTRTKTMILADGNHRYYCLNHHGRSIGNAWLISEELWRPYQIAGLPKTTEEETLKSFSGVL